MPFGANYAIDMYPTLYEQTSPQIQYIQYKLKDATIEPVAGQQQRTCTAFLLYLQVLCIAQTQQTTQPDAMDSCWSSTSSPVTGSGSDCEAGDACAAGEGTNCSVLVELPTSESSVNRVVLVFPSEGLMDDDVAAGAAAGAERL